MNDIGLVALGIVRGIVEDEVNKNGVVTTVSSPFSYSTSTTRANGLLIPIVINIRTEIGRLSDSRSKVELRASEVLNLIPEMKQEMKNNNIYLSHRLTDNRSYNDDTYYYYSITIDFNVLDLESER